MDSKKIFWIDQNLDNIKTSHFIDNYNSINSLNIKTFETIDKAIESMKEINFVDIKVIVTDKLYNDFVKGFKENITYMKIAPKLIVFAKDIEKFKLENSQYEDKENIFYTFGGIATTYEEISKFLKNEFKPENLKEPDEVQLTFDCIKNKEDLVLPIFFKTLIDKESKENMEKFTNDIYNTYSEKNERIKDLLGIIKSMRNIPVEILSKFYAKLYTAQSDFYKEMNKELGSNNGNKYKYLPFIKILYEGVKLKALPLASDKELYRGVKISNGEIENIKEFLKHKNKKDNLPGCIVFSKSFLSFTKEKQIAEHFLNSEKNNENNNNNNADLSKVLFILEKDDTLGYNLLTHGDIEEISFYPYEKEVLFFPFSSFEIKDIKPKESIYEIKLLYLGKYLKDIDNNDYLIKNEDNIPESKFKEQIKDSGLIKKEKIEHMKIKEIHKEYKNYENEIKEHEIKSNKIIGEIYITKDDINNNIQIINSFENTKRVMGVKINKDEKNNKNEEEIINNVEIKINGEIISFSYTHKFKKEGKYKIEYLFKKNLVKANHLFYKCTKLTNLDLSHLNTKDVINMSYMFYYCISLKNLDLSNFDTKNVVFMNYMFGGCNSLTNINIAKLNTEKVINMSGLFSNCNSLTHLDLSNFNTKNVKDMSNIFNQCQELIDLNLSNFDTQNVVYMNEMFNNCFKLPYLDLSSFNTKNVKNMKEMFNNCFDLENLKFPNLNTQNVINMDNMFFSCNSLKNFNYNIFG